MAITYKWLISSMNEYPKTDDLDNVVFSIHYRRQAIEMDGDKTWYADTYNTISVPAPDPENYTPYDQLTFEQVCGWLESVINMEAMDESLARQIEQQKNPPVVSLPLPWLQPAVQETIVEQPIQEIPIVDTVNEDSVVDDTTEDVQPKEESTWEGASPAEESSSEEPA